MRLVLHRFPSEGDCSTRVFQRCPWAVSQYGEEEEEQSNIITTNVQRELISAKKTSHEEHNSKDLNLTWLASNSHLACE